ncbi:hypothetical protein, partial [Haladaptatus sp. W1]|uniref:hypothetical protein n=1 Tax=Haladaptatus sp. W1 TaxID=1897478 RepID=UPI001C30B769
GTAERTTASVFFIRGTPTDGLRYHRPVNAHGTRDATAEDTLERYITVRDRYRRQVVSRTLETVSLGVKNDEPQECDYVGFSGISEPVSRLH